MRREARSTAHACAQYCNVSTGQGVAGAYRQRVGPHAHGLPRVLLSGAHCEINRVSGPNCTGTRVIAV
eukprot:2428010-Rhodomonas_salina.2